MGPGVVWRRKKKKRRKWEGREYLYLHISHALAHTLSHVKDRSLFAFLCSLLTECYMPNRVIATKPNSEGEISEQVTTPIFLLSPALLDRTGARR